MEKTSKFVKNVLNRDDPYVMNYIEGFADGLSGERIFLRFIAKSSRLFIAPFLFILAV